MDTSRQRLSRPRAQDGITPAFDSKTEAFLDEHSPWRNPDRARPAAERARTEEEDAT